MKGKLRKIALGMSVLMCAGMIFTCVMPAKAMKPMCDHSITHALFGWTDWHFDEDDYDDEGHYWQREELAGCGICGETFTLNTERKSYPHVCMILTDEEDGFTFKWCKICNYSCTYYEKSN